MENSLENAIFSRRIALVAVGLAGWFALKPSSPSSDTRDETSDVPSLPPAASRGEIERILATRLDAADAELAETFDECLRPVHDLFASAMRGVPAFVDKALSFKSKGRLAWAALPLTDSTAHERYLKRKFEQFILSEAALEQALGQCISLFARHVDDAENRMLVMLRADMQQMPGEFTVPHTDHESLRTQYEASLRTVGRASGDDLVRTVAELTLSSVVGALVTKLMTRLAASGVIYGAGAAGAGVTFGLTLVAAFIIDYLIGRIVDWYYRPQETLAADLRSHLTQIRHLLIDGEGGEGGKGGLRQGLAEVAEARSRLRRQAVEHMYFDEAAGLHSSSNS